MSSRRAGASLADRARRSEPPRRARRQPGPRRHRRSASAPRCWSSCDGMGGHADGAQAAEAAQPRAGRALLATQPQPLFDPLGFLHLALGRAHERRRRARRGTAAGASARARPAPCAWCRTRLGLLGARRRQPRLPPARRARRSTARATTATSSCCCARAASPSDQAQDHPMRNFVECCLGGDPMLPEMTHRPARKRAAAGRRAAWSAPTASGPRATTTSIARRALRRAQPLRDVAAGLGERAVVAAAARPATTPPPPRVRMAGPLSSRYALCDPAAARLTNCARCASPAATPRTPKARCWSSSATRACCAPPASRKACRRFLRGKGQGWVTAEYGMLPRATHTRTAARGRARQAGRPHAGDPAADRPRRCARSSTSRALGERTITLDCDVLQADGGTRTASITGAYVALADALRRAGAPPGHRRERRCTARSPPSRSASSAARRCSTSTTPRTRSAETDMNVVMNNGGGFIEIQGTAEGHAFRRARARRAAGPGQRGAASSFSRPSLRRCRHRSRRRPRAQGGERARARVPGAGGPRDRQRRQAARVARAARAAGTSRCRRSPRLHDRRPRTRPAYLRRECAAEGAPCRARLGTAGDRRRFGSRGGRTRRRAGRALGALCGAAADDEANNRKLLRELEQVAADARTARYRCAIVFLRWRRRSRPPIVAGHAGTAASRDAPRGSGGFGYDPLFVVAGTARTAAEFEPAQKNARQPSRPGAACAGRSAWRSSSARRAVSTPRGLPLSLYVHLPWCVRKCPYCDFNSHAVARRAARRGATSRRCSPTWPRGRDGLGRSRDLSVFFGGGTPSLFSAEAIARLLDGTARSCCRSPPTPRSRSRRIPAPSSAAASPAIAMPGSIACRSASQSFDDRHAAGARPHPCTATKRVAAVAELRAARPRQLQSRPDVRPAGAAARAGACRCGAALALAPPHLSHYQLTLEPGTLFSAQPPPSCPTTTRVCDMQQRLPGRLAPRASSNTRSRPTRDRAACRHNLNYWQFGDYLGIGAGAHGKITDPRSGEVTRTERVKQPGRYLAAARAEDRLAERRAVGGRDLPFEFFLNALRLTDGFDVSLFEERTGLPLATVSGELERARERGLVERSVTGRLAPTKLGRLFLNDLQACFLPGRLRRAAPGSRNPADNRRAGAFRPRNRACAGCPPRQLFTRRMQMPRFAMLQTVVKVLLGPALKALIYINKIHWSIIDQCDNWPFLRSGRITVIRETHTVIHRFCG